MFSSSLSSREKLLLCLLIGLVLTHPHLCRPIRTCLTLPHPSSSVHIHPSYLLVPICSSFPCTSWSFPLPSCKVIFSSAPHSCSPVLTRPTRLSSAFSAGVHGAAQPAAGLLHPHPPVQRPARVRLQHRGGESAAGVPAGVQRDARRTAGAQHR